MTTVHSVLDSPLGPLTLVVTDGALTGLWMSDQRHRPAGEGFGDRVPDALPAAREQLAAYFDAALTAFDLPLAPYGTPFRRRVWSALREIPYGATTTYGRLAAAIGNPAASRAVGLANGRNPISIVVPCHRVVGADGSLTGYGGGLDRKRVLLALEGADGPASGGQLPFATDSGG